jgi:hypothetical protein
MTSVPTGEPCRQHFWERCLEVHGGIECVVRFCRPCGRKEVCWSRRPLPPEVAAAVQSSSDQRD